MDRMLAEYICKCSDNFRFFVIRDSILNDSSFCIAHCARLIDTRKLSVSHSACATPHCLSCQKKQIYQETKDLRDSPYSL